MNKTDNAGTIAVVYARYSSHSQSEQSIEGQLSAAHTYADARGYTIIHEYIDRAVSGRTDNREEFQKMLSDTAKKQFQVIILWKVDRFGRNREEITFNKYRCKKNGVRVEYVAENVPDSPEGVILESVLEGMAEYYSLQLSQNIRRGQYEGAKKHHVLGGNVPLGYKAVDKKYVVDEAVAPVIREIYELYASGHGIAQILRQLNAEGHRTRYDRPFTKSSLRTILKNENYIGTYVFKDLIHDENAIPAIVDKDVFYKVQEMLKINKRKPHSDWDYSDFLLTGKLYCGLCGSEMIGTSGYGKLGTKYNYYNCLSQRKKTGCRKKPIRADLLEPLILDEAENLLLDDKVLDFIVDKTWEYYLKADLAGEKIKGIKKKIAEIENSTKNLVKTIELGVVTEVILNRLKELETQKTALKKALAEAELERGFELTKDSIRFFLEKFKSADIRDRDFQKRLVDVFINAIYLYDDKLDIVFNFRENPETIALSDIQRAESNQGFDRARYSGPGGNRTRVRKPIH